MFPSVALTFSMDGLGCAFARAVHPALRENLDRDGNGKGCE